MRLDDKNQRRSYEQQFYQMQSTRKHPVRGILIYEQARKKLDISEDGYLYRQKWYSYLPIIGPILSLIYAYYCLGKVKCLRRKDEVLFNNAKILIRIFGYLVWPLIFLAFWTLLSYIGMDFASSASSAFGKNSVFGDGDIFGKAGAYAANWQALLINPLQQIANSPSPDVGRAIAIFFGGLAKLFVYPLMPGPEYGFANTYVGCNIIFIVSVILLTIINPVNIFNTLSLNKSVLRFTIVYETSNIYRYRNTGV